MSAKTPATSPRRSKDETTNPDLALAGIGNYVFQKTVGEGNFAKVKLSTHKLTKAEVAIKVIDKSHLDEKKMSKLYREVRIMKLLNHPNIVKLYEVIETKHTLFLVMEYASRGELYDYLVVHGKLKEKEARAKFRQILSAVSYCHKKKVIHRDLKAENLLLDANLNVKIADFGFSNWYDPESKLDTFCGSPPYAAPELFQGRRYTGPEVDVWSLGVILYVLSTGCLPFDGKNLQEMREAVCRGKYRIPFYLTDTCEKLLRKFLVRDPAKRANLDFLIDDPWINETYADSPITTDISSIMVEDDKIITLVEQKFKIDRETILKAVRDDTYNDIAAIYYLLYHNQNSVDKVSAESLDIVQISARQKSINILASPTMIVIAEDDVLPQIGVVSEPKKTAVPVQARRRAQTTTTKVGALIAATSTAAAAAGEGGDGGIAAETKSSFVSKHSSIQEPSPGSPSASAPSPNVTDRGDSTNGNKTPVLHQRARTNTITGIFRRKQTEEAPSTAGSEDTLKPRSLRFTFNSNTTSCRPPEELLEEIKRACESKDVTYRMATGYLLECSKNGTEPMKFEVEICKLPRLNNLHGLRFKRISGSSSEYKAICEFILETVHL